MTIRKINMECVLGLGKAITTAALVLILGCSSPNTFEIDPNVSETIATELAPKSLDEHPAWWVFFSESDLPKHFPPGTDPMEVLDMPEMGSGLRCNCILKDDTLRVFGGADPSQGGIGYGMKITQDHVEGTMGFFGGFKRNLHESDYRIKFFNPAQWEELTLSSGPPFETGTTLSGIYRFKGQPYEEKGNPEPFVKYMKLWFRCQVVEFKG